MKDKDYLKRLEAIKKMLDEPLIGGLLNFDNFFDTFFSGKIKNEKGSGDLGEWTKSTYISEDGDYRITTYKLNSQSNDKNGLYDLDLQLKKCIADQNYEEAAIIRDKIKSLKENKTKVDQLNKELEDAIKTQDFERAIEIRDQLKKIN